MDSGISVQAFGKTALGEDVLLYKLTNKNGITLEITNYGGIVVRLIVPDRNGKFDDVVLGFNTFEEYQKDNSTYFGAIIGRYANRIAHGRFILNGIVYQLALNNDPNGIPCSLHGGNVGFNKVLWKGSVDEGADIPKLNLSYLSKDGEEGYPGNLEVLVTYSLTDNNELRIEYTASTDKTTPLNLTNHSYFNLKGEGSGDILDHLIKINAEQFTPVNKGLIPTGEIRPVEGTPFDFRVEHVIGERISEDNEQLKLSGGYDQNYVLNKKEVCIPLSALAYEPSTGRLLEVYTTEPGLQFYSGNFLDGSLTGKKGMPYNHRNGFALEAQHFPDSPNHPEFPSAMLKPGEIFKSVTSYKFSTR